MSGLPEVRQCTADESHLFGAVAVKSGENRWGIMVPINMETGAGGGHWGTDTDVAGWATGVFPETP